MAKFEKGREDPVTRRVDNESVNTGQPGRTLVSKDDREIYVDPDGDDDAAGTESDPVESIQEAVDRVPCYLQHEWKIWIQPGDYDEHVKIHSIVGTGEGAQRLDGEEFAPLRNIEIGGDGDSPSDVTVNSFVVGSCWGLSIPRIRDLMITEETDTYGSRPAGIQVFGSATPSIWDVEWADGIETAILAYGSRVNCRDIDIGDNNVDHGFESRRDGCVILRDSEGTSTNEVYVMNHGTIIDRDGSFKNGGRSAATGWRLYNGDGWLVDGGESVHDDFFFSDEFAEIPIPDENRVEIKIRRIRSNSTSGTIGMQVSDDGGDTWLDGSIYTWQHDGPSTGSDADDDMIVLGDGINDTGSRRANPITIETAMPGRDDDTMFSWRYVHELDGGLVRGGGFSQSDTQVDTVRIFEIDDGPTTINELAGIVTSHET